MMRRYVTVWFRHLKTDWFSRRDPALRKIPFVLVVKQHGRMIISAVNAVAQQQGMFPGMVLADARAIFPGIHHKDDVEGLAHQLIKAIAEYSICFSPNVSVDNNNGIIINATGCAHLWNGEQQYLKAILKRFSDFGYTVKAAIADTIGAAWAVTHFTNEQIIPSGEQKKYLLPLPPASLRLSTEAVQLMGKLGLRTIRDFIEMPRIVLQRRFGDELLQRLDQSIGIAEEFIEPVKPISPYTERLQCIDPIVNASGIEIAIELLLEMLCKRLNQESKGIRTLVLQCYCIDGRISQIEIGTSRATTNTTHLFKLLELRIPTIEPGAGIELFAMDATKVDDLAALQEKLWNNNGGLNDPALSTFIDCITNKLGYKCVVRYQPAEHHWPERSFTATSSLEENITEWKIPNQRPIHLLHPPERIEVTAPIPDYPPMLFRYKGTLHKIIKADGPERIEREWWIEEGPHRDYYTVEDAKGCRYWLFRSGHYTENKPDWFIHGFFE